MNILFKTTKLLDYPVQNWYNIGYISKEEILWTKECKIEVISLLKR